MNSRIRTAVLAVSIAAVTSLVGAGSAQAGSLWGAIAEGSDGFSTVTNYPSKQEAIDAAVAQCNQSYPVRWVNTGSGGGYNTGGNCSWRVAFPSGSCAAIAAGYELDSNGKLESSASKYSVGFGESVAEADYDAIAKNTGYKAYIVRVTCQD